MSIWISDHKITPVTRRLAALVAGLLLAGCVAAGGSGPQSAAGRPAVSFLGGQIKAAPPPGYCLYPEASHDSADTAVIVMGRCPGAAVEPALIAVSVGAPGSSAVLKNGAKALSDYFLSPAGRAALARDGRASSVRVTRTALSEGALILHLEDRTTGPCWRAVLGLNGRLVTVAVTVPEGGRLSDADGRALLDAATGRIRSANRSSAATASAAPAPG